MVFQNSGIFGFDVSFYQRIAAHDGLPAKEIDFNRMKAYGADFVIIKAGQHTYTDPGFIYNWEHAKLAKIPRGSYWFEDKDSSPKDQAVKYWNLIKNDIGEGVCVMDFEDGSHTDLNSAYVFLDNFQQKSGLPDNKIVVYTGYPFWNAAKATSLSQRSWFRKFPLWLAWYTSDVSEVRIPYPWSKVTFWQDGTPSIGLQVGVQSREIDHDFFNGTREDFKLYFKDLGDEPMPDITFTGTVKSTATLGVTVRETPAGTPTGQKLFPGTAVQGVGTLQTAVLNGVTYEWMNIVSPTIGWVATSLLDYAPVNVTPTTHKLEVFVDGVLEYTKEF